MITGLKKMTQMKVGLFDSSRRTLFEAENRSIFYHELSLISEELGLLTTLNDTMNLKY